ncbi:anthrone oxygenase family protein [Paenibacillus caseinilyticus]|uniref:DUF1772 domain-containing protein n=1 Tax=Paenibacillus mucilaginosus K02 TaxID=997761 RepID=I0BT29_9BACL|nr:anthrone oxygenase family protein [Paenibacillus mucilaginosus]AFH65526.1 hypothetical protein B2K_33320 [Paenibacillus mucilaginosus K02]
MNKVIGGLLLGGTLGTGLMAGFFWSFSFTVMPGLDLTDPLAAMASMQGINLAVRNPVFFAGYFGTPLLCLLLALASFRQWRGLQRWVVLCSSLVYLLGVFAVTSAFNVPLNEQLAVLNPELAENAGSMIGYIEEWTQWNHVRTFSSLAAFLFFSLVLMQGRRSAVQGQGVSSPVQ